MLPEPLTICVCPQHGVQVPESEGFMYCMAPNVLDGACTLPLEVVEVFRAETVRPLYEATAFGPDLAGDDPPPYLADAVKAFPAPDEWRSAGPGDDTAGQEGSSR